MIRRYFPRSVKDLVHWYERYISPLALIAGFFADNYILLRRVDLWRTNALLFAYLAISALGIIVINLIESGRLPRNERIRGWIIAAAPIVPVVVQFSFGGLFSGFLSLYSRSAASATTWVFVLVIAALLLGNERFTRLYVRFSFQVSLYFTVLFSFLIFFIPVVSHSISPVMFVISGVASLVLVAAFVYLHYLLVPDIVRREGMLASITIALIFVAFNSAYFLNLIPPLPLALKSAGVYHMVQREGDTYILRSEPSPWYRRYINYNTVFRHAPGEPVYVFSAVFAPTKLSTEILHEWQHYDEVSHAWVTVSTIRFSINGGRDGGYRGYTAKSDIAAGTWRVNVLTPHGQVIGRVAFSVVDVPEPVVLELSTQ